MGVGARNGLQGRQYSGGDPDGGQEQACGPGDHDARTEDEALLQTLFGGLKAPFKVLNPFIKPRFEVQHPLLKASNIFFRGEAFPDVLRESGNDGSGLLFVEAGLPQPQSRLEGVKQRHATIVAGSYSFYNHFERQSGGGSGPVVPSA